MHKLIREPLLHFLIVGALLFGAYAWLNRGENDTGGIDTTIRITEREVTWLTDTFARLSLRPPNDIEMRGLLVDYLREELLAREARGLELDRDDLIVRRRLAQKMTFILEDTANLATPTDDELQALYAAESGRFDVPARVSFTTVYFSSDKRGERARADAEAALGKLAASGRGPDPATLGDSSLLPAEMQDADEQAIAGSFGEEFARTVVKLKPDEWQGPIESSFGQHLVRVTDRQEAEARPFDVVRNELIEEWRRRAQETAKNAYFKGLLQRYDIEATESVRPLIAPALATIRGDDQ